MRPRGSNAGAGCGRPAGGFHPQDRKRGGDKGRDGSLVGQCGAQAVTGLGRLDGGVELKKETAAATKGPAAVTSAGEATQPAAAVGGSSAASPSETATMAATVTWYEALPSLHILARQFACEATARPDNSGLINHCNGHPCEKTYSLSTEPLVSSPLSLSLSGGAAGAPEQMLVCSSNPPLPPGVLEQSEHTQNASRGHPVHVVPPWYTFSVYLRQRWRSRAVDLCAALSSLDIFLASLSAWWAALTTAFLEASSTILRCWSWSMNGECTPPVVTTSRPL